MKLYSFKQLTVDLHDVGEAKALLMDAQIPVISGYFDKDRLDAVLAMPKELRSKRLEWNLSPTHGIGAVKACVDQANLNLSAHYLNRRNAIDITDKKGNTRLCKMYYVNKASQENTVATFTLKNFLDDDPTTYYALCALCIPAMWIFSNKELRSKWTRLRFNTEKINAVHLDDPTGIYIPVGHWRNQKGGLRFRLSSHESPWRVSAAALGL